MAIQIWQPGDKIKNDRFHILKQLGKGGFGITYLAEDTVKKQQIVIKTLNANQQGEADFAQKQENFVKEGFTLTKFNHPHIVKVYEPIQIGDLWGLVMEYIPGQDLADYIIANGRLGEAEALNYIDQIAQALDCVHQQKFFHRDVKPHNIMLRQDRGEAVLIDFGIAKEFVDLETIYLSNSLGTELYKPIEQYEKRGQFGAYTDIYALAVTLYHLLTGAAPGGGSPLYTSKARKDAQDKGWGDKLDEHLWGDLVNAGVSEGTQAAIKAGMTIDPSQRPQTMTAFRELLGLAKEKLIKTESELDRDQNWFNRGEKLYDLGRYEEALSNFDRALEIEPDDVLAQVLRGASLYELERYNEALHSFDRALEIEPDDVLAQTLRGFLLHKLGRHNEAISSLDRCLENNPGNAATWALHGDILTEIEQYERAINSYVWALKIDPNTSLYWQNHGKTLLKLGKYKEAVISFNRALAIESDSSEAWCCRGQAQTSLGEYKEAKASFDRVLEIAPDNSLCWFYYGSLWSSLGRKKKKLPVTIDV